MKKIFTLIATAFIAMGANAQESGLFDYETAYADGQEISSENCVLKLGDDMKGWKVSATKVSADGYLAAYGKTLTLTGDDGEYEQFSAVTLVGQNNPKDQAVSGKGSGINCAEGKTSARLPQNGSYYILKPTKSGAIQIGIILNADKAFYLIDATETTTDEEGYINVPLPEANIHDYVIKNANGESVSLSDDGDAKGGKIVSEKTTGVIEFNVVAGHTYYFFCTGSKLSCFGYIFTPTGDSPASTGDSYKPINVADDGTISLASEFLACVNDNSEAQNVKDGKSVITVNTDNVTVEAVGGATPANVDGGAQDITPGTAMSDYVDQKGEAHPYAYKVASVGSWAPITWKNGNNKLDINDAEGTKLYFLMGSGNPYINMFCEEIVTDDVPQGKYRALYEYYKPGMDMPQVGLYYKFTSKVDGKMKIQIWANKGNRNTYLINGQTKQAVAYKVEGYINGQKMKDEEGNNILNDEGKEIMRLFTADEIQQLHNDAKVVDGVDTAPYVIAAGNQAFWGWITFDAKAGVDYWLFQDSSQIGFGGFEFTTGGTDGIENVQVVKVQNNKMYNLQGQVVGEDYKGIVIKNGKKFLKK